MKLAKITGSIGCAAAAALSAAPVSARGQEAPFSLSADWVGEACVLPARFRIVLSNTGERAVWVPTIQQLGHGRPINFIAAFGDEQFSSERFFTGPPSTDLVLVEPGDSYVYAVDFDGYFSAHGGPVGDPKPWQGRIAFYYYLSDIVAAWFTVGPEGVLVHGEEPEILSNVLTCP